MKKLTLALGLLFLLSCTRDTISEACGFEIGDRVYTTVVTEVAGERNELYIEMTVNDIKEDSVSVITTSQVWDFRRYVHCSEINLLLDE